MLSQNLQPPQNNKKAAGEDKRMVRRTRLRERLSFFVNQ